MAATQEQIDNLTLEIKSQFIQKGFKFGVVEPDYLELGIEAYAKIILEHGGSADVAANIDWNLVDVESMMAVITNELIQDPLYIDLTAGIKDIYANLTDDWEPKEYSVGDRVLYSGSIYECTADVLPIDITTNPETLTANWNKVGIFEDIQYQANNISSRISNLQEVSDTSVSNIENLNLTINGDGGSNPGLSATIQQEQSIRALSVAPDWTNDTAYEKGDTVAYGYNVDLPDEVQLWQVIDETVDFVTYPTWAQQIAQGYWVPIDKNIYAQYSVKLDIDGVVSGFGIAGDTTGTSFIIKADKFAIFAPGKVDGLVPFYVDANDNNVYMENAFIKDLSADNFVGNTITANSISLATGITDSVDYSTLGDVVDKYDLMSDDMLVLATNSAEFVTALPGIEDGITNFNDRNDRLTETPADPTIANDGSAISFTFNSDSTCNIVFNWIYDLPINPTVAEQNAYNIDGFIVYLKDDIYNTAHVISVDNISEYQYFQADSSKRTARIMSLTPDKYYTIGIEAYRIVDQDVDSSGILRSNIVQSSFPAEDPIFLSRTIEPPNTVTIQEL